MDPELKEIVEDLDEMEKILMAEKLARWAVQLGWKSHIYQQLTQSTVQNETTALIFKKTRGAK